MSQFVTVTALGLDGSLREEVLVNFDKVRMIKAFSGPGGGSVLLFGDDHADRETMIVVENLSDPCRSSGHTSGQRMAGWTRGNARGGMTDKPANGFAAIEIVNQDGQLFAKFPECFAVKAKSASVGLVCGICGVRWPCRKAHQKIQDQADQKRADGHR